MKAKPFRVVDGEHVECAPEDAEYLELRFPGPSGLKALPVILHGRRDGHPRGVVWTWNGSTEAPTLRPSVRSHGGDYLCHTWVSDGQAQFLDDCTHELRGKTFPMLEV
jgi:hypothetical protein